MIKHCYKLKVGWWSRCVDNLTILFIILLVNSKTMSRMRCGAVRCGARFKIASFALVRTLPCLLFNALKASRKFQESFKKVSMTLTILVVWCGYSVIETSVPRIETSFSKFWAREVVKFLHEKFFMRSFMKFHTFSTLKVSIYYSL